MDWRLLLAPIGVIALLAMATNDDPYPNGTDKSTHKRVLSPVGSCSDNRGSPHARDQRVGIELESIITSRKRTGSDGSAEGRATRTPN